MAPPDVLWSFKHSHHNWTFDRILEVCQIADSTDDFHAVFFNDHLYGSTLEGWSTMATIFARTRRIRSGLWVMSNSFRHPSLVAKMAATMDVLSGGRFILGLGASHEEDEFRAYGLPFPPAGERVRRLDETCQILGLAFSGQPVSFHGRYYQINDATFLPAPVQKPRPHLAIGCRGDKAMRVAARYADEWSIARINTEADGFIERSRYLDAACRDIGRDPATIRRCASYRYLYEGFRSGRLSRTTVVADARRIIDHGCRHFVFMLGDGADGAREVAFLRDEFIPEVMSGY